MVAVKSRAGSVSSKVNKSDDALVCSCLVCVNLLHRRSIFAGRKKHLVLTLCGHIVMLTYVKTIVRESVTLFVHMGDQNRPLISNIYVFLTPTLILLLLFILGFFD